MIDVDAHVGQILTRMRPRLVGWARRRGYDLNDAEDLANIACATVWKQRLQLRSSEEAPIKSYLWLVASRTRVRDGSRSVVRTQRVSNLHEQVDVSADDSDGDAERRALAYRVLYRLPLPSRRVLFAWCASGSHRETSQRLGMGYDAARQAYSRATRQARQILAEIGDGLTVPRFHLQPDRLSSVAMLACVEERVVIHLLLEPDWSNGAEHQEWLDTAPVVEIVDWLMMLLES